MIELKPGALVLLRNGRIRGPLRDRSHENDMWPWGEVCAHCGQSLPTERVWRPDGKASRYTNSEAESDYDIVGMV